MHIQMPEMEIVIGNNWGKLGILGSVNKGSGSRPSQEPHHIQLILQYPDNFNLAYYSVDDVGPELNLFRRYLGCEDCKVFRTLNAIGVSYVIFELLVKGKLRNPRGFLKNVARKLNKVIDRIVEIENDISNTMLDESA